MDPMCLYEPLSSACNSFSDTNRRSTRKEACICRLMPAENAFVIFCKDPGFFSLLFVGERQQKSTSSGSLKQKINLWCH